MLRLDPMKGRWHYLDLFGGTATLICVLHCLATPILLISFPFLASERFELGLAAFLISLASVAIIGGAIQHGHRLALVPYAAGVLAFVLVWWLGPDNHLNHVVAALLASILLMVAHVINFRYCRYCPEHDAFEDALHSHPH